MTMVVFKNLYGGEVNNLIEWFSEIKEKYDINIDYTNHIIDDMVCDFSFELRKFNIEVKSDYIVITLRKHPVECFEVYDIDFTEFTIK